MQQPTEELWRLPDKLSVDFMRGARAMEIAHGPEQVVGELYATYGPMIHRYLKRLIGSHKTAEELLQETFIKALQHWEQLRKREHVRTWLCEHAASRLLAGFSVDVDEVFDAG